MKIYRAIRANSINNINLNNIGLHWSESEDHAYDVAKRGYREGEGEVYTIIANVADHDINISATIESRLEYPREYEICLNEFVTLNVEVKNESWETEYKGTANSGNLCDRWLEEGNYTDWEATQEYEEKKNEVGL